MVRTGSNRFCVEPRAPPATDLGRRNGAPLLLLTVGCDVVDGKLRRTNVSQEEVASASASRWADRPSRACIPLRLERVCSCELGEVDPMLTRLIKSAAMPVWRWTEEAVEEAVIFGCTQAWAGEGVYAGGVGEPNKSTAAADPRRAPRRVSALVETLLATVEARAGA